MVSRCRLNNPFAVMRKSEGGTGWRKQGHRATQQMSIQHRSTGQGCATGVNENWRGRVAWHDGEEGPGLNPGEALNMQQSLQPTS